MSYFPRDKTAAGSMARAFAIRWTRNGVPPERIASVLIAQGMTSEGVPKILADAAAFDPKHKAPEIELYAKHLAALDTAAGYAVPSTGRRLTLTWANTITMKAVRWLWHRRIPIGALSLVAGREGAGKSTFVYWMIAQLTRGTLPGKHFGTPRNVIVVATEDSWEHTIAPRLTAAGADLSKVARVDVAGSEHELLTEALSLPADLPALQVQIAESDAAIVLLDPLMSRLSGTLDTHKDAEVRKALEPLVRIADAAGVVVLGIIHVNKGASRDPLNMIMGSRAFGAVARSVLFVMVDPDDEQTRLIGNPKGNLGPEMPTLKFQIDEAIVGKEVDGTEISTGKLSWTGEDERTIRDAVRQDPDNRAGDRQTARDGAAAWLSAYLSARRGSADSKLVKTDGRQAGHSEGALKRAARDLRIGMESHGYPRATTWILPGMTRSMLTIVGAPPAATASEPAPDGPETHCEY